MYDSLREKIDKAIKKDVPSAVLFSGGIDSSVILYHAHKYNPNVMAITVAVDEKDSFDIEYSKKVAKDLGIINHQICYVDKLQINEMIENSVKILKSFNPEWVSSTTTLLLGTLFAKKSGLNSISSGEGADDLLGSFPFFVNWKGNKKELEEFIKVRLNEINVMSSLIANNLNIRYIAPFQNELVKEEILNIPIDERMKTDGNIKTKYPLRKAYENILPKICITRPQTMAFSGSGVYNLIKKIGDDISKEEFDFACNKYFKFRNKFEYKLFTIYKKYFEFSQVEKGCVHCGSDMNGNKINCKVCSTLQIDGREIFFDGNDEKNIFGAEAIVIHNGNIVLGMQSKKRWYMLDNNKNLGIIKTIGGKIEKEDHESCKKTVLREFFEEIKGIDMKDLKISNNSVFYKSVNFDEINPYEKNSKLKLNAKFYIIEIKENKKIFPGDIPFLLEIPIEDYLRLNKEDKLKLKDLKDYIISCDMEILPDYCYFMVPKEVDNILKPFLKNDKIISYYNS